MPGVCCRNAFVCQHKQSNAIDIIQLNVAVTSKRRIEEAIDDDTHNLSMTRQHRPVTRLPLCVNWMREREHRQRAQRDTCHFAFQTKTTRAVVTAMLYYHHHRSRYRKEFSAVRLGCLERVFSIDKDIDSYVGHFLSHSGNWLNHHSHCIGTKAFVTRLCRVFGHLTDRHQKHTV